MTTIALITARGGSKGLYRKNIKKVNGKPLIEYTIKAALGCCEIDHVFVSTEDEEIAQTSIHLGAKIIDRPKNLAEDQSSSESVIEHAIKWLESNNFRTETMILLQPTSPLRKNTHIKEAFQIYATKKASCVISVYEPCHSQLKGFVELHDGTIQGIYSASAPYQRRQDLPKSYQPNGAIYIFSVKEFLINDYIPRVNVYPYEMSLEDSIDIDTIDDLKLVELRLKRNQNESSI